jgi:hypothetical protein
LSREWEVTDHTYAPEPAALTLKPALIGLAYWSDNIFRLDLARLDAENPKRHPVIRQ